MALADLPHPEERSQSASRRTHTVDPTQEFGGAMLVEPSYDLVLDHLRAIRGGIDGLHEDLREVKGRLTAVELGLASVRREIAALAEADAHLSARIDRFSDRLERIERRLELIPAS
jgi:septal ring factor EnvC (AmiA/AmiB activator)